jgi:hypothetical protein
MGSGKSNDIYMSFQKIKRTNANESIEIPVVQDNSSLNVKTTGGGCLRIYGINSKHRLCLLSFTQITFDSKIVIRIATLDKILSNIGLISEKITINTNVFLII